MLVVGLTGGIGMGKSEAAKHLARRGVKVFNADACVHGLYEGEAVEPIEAAFSGVAKDGKVDRGLLSKAIAGSPERNGEHLAVLEIPLLFETDAHKRVDVTIVLSAPDEVQRERVLARPGMTVDKLEHLLARQLPDAEKRARADFVVDSALPLAAMHAELDALLESLRGRQGTVMERLRSR